MKAEFSLHNQIPDSIKIHTVQPRYYMRTARQTDTTILIVTFRNFANFP